MKTTAVIPCRNERDHIGSVFDAIDAQTRPVDQVLVVDGMSTDGTREIVQNRAERDMRIRLLNNPSRTTPHALNIALKEIIDGLFVRVDAHTFPAPNYVQETLRVFAERDGVAGVGAHKRGIASTRQGVANQRAYQSRFVVGNSQYHFEGADRVVDHVPFGVYRVEAVKEIGGWDERFLSHQDYELDYRLRQAGHTLMLSGTTSIDWQMRENLPDLFRQYVRYGDGKARLIATHPSAATARAVVPLSLWVWTALSLSPLSGPFKLAVRAAYPAYALFAGAEASAGRSLLRSAAASVAIQFGWATGLAKGTRHFLATDNAR